MQDKQFDAIMEQLMKVTEHGKISMKMDTFSPIQN